MLSLYTVGVRSSGNIRFTATFSARVWLSAGLVESGDNDRHMHNSIHPSYRSEVEEDPRKYTKCVIQLREAEDPLVSCVFSRTQRQRTASLSSHHMASSCHQLTLGMKVHLSMPQIPCR